MELNGIGGPRNVHGSLEYLRAASDLGPWGGQLRDGFDRYLVGDYESALLLYARARSVLGDGIAAGNVAYLLHRGLAGAALEALENDEDDDLTQDVRHFAPATVADFLYSPLNEFHGMHDEPGLSAGGTRMYAR